MKIGDLAKKTGVSVQTIRYYEKHGIIPKASRTESGYRIYSDDTVDRILFIKNAQELGFSLEKIKKLHEIKSDRESKGLRVKIVLKQEIDEIDEKIQSLTAMRDYLVKLDNECSGEMSADCCPILNNIQSGVHMREED